MSGYSDDLWDRVGKRMEERNITEADIGQAIKAVRAENKK